MAVGGVEILSCRVKPCPFFVDPAGGGLLLPNFPSLTVGFVMEERERGECEGENEEKKKSGESREEGG